MKIHFFFLLFILLWESTYSYSHDKKNFNSYFNKYSISFFEDLDDDFFNHNVNKNDSDHFYGRSAYRSFLNSGIYRTGRTAAKMSKTDMDKYFFRKIASINLCDIQWYLYLYLHNSTPADSLKKYYSLYQTVNKLIAVSRILNKVDFYGNDKIKYSLDGLITMIDTTAISYFSDRVVQIGNIRIEYNGDDVIDKIGDLIIEYDSGIVKAIGGKRSINQPMLNRQYRTLSYFEKRDFIDRQKTLPSLIGIYNVLYLYLANTRHHNDTLTEQFSYLLQIIRTAILATQRLKCTDVVDNRIISCKFGRIEYIDDIKLEYFFDHLDRINDIRIDYFFERISRIGDLTVKWHDDEIYQIGVKRIKRRRE